MEQETETCTRKPIALFMAFGTKGDVFPIAAIAAAFASDQTQYQVIVLTHSAHQNLESHLAKKYVTFVSISSPPVVELGSSQNKRSFTHEHRKECVLAIEGIFGHGPNHRNDFILINFFALEGWSFAELFRIKCVVASPYVIPYSAPPCFEAQFRKEFPCLYKCLKEATLNKVSWKDVMHWMWPVFSEDWGMWRRDELSLSPCPFTDPVTELPSLHDWPACPLLLYGFSKEIVECPEYWPANVRVCGFWFVPDEWQYSCKECAAISVLRNDGRLCSGHSKLEMFLTKAPVSGVLSQQPIFIGLSSIGSMGFLADPEAFIQVIKTVLEITNYRFILLTANYKHLDDAIRSIAIETCLYHQSSDEETISLFDGRLFCYSGMIPYKWLFPRCAVAIHHGGSGSTAAALFAGIPQVLCPFMLDQFYWAEKMHWLGVAPETLKRQHLVPATLDDMKIRIASNVLSRAINEALSPEVKARASEIAQRLSAEDGVMEAVRILKEEMHCCEPNLLREEYI